ncbi:hypothetical protein Dsin_012663 [Dipteronia sinensis]|uniref:Cyclic nucleotide-binding domain-containing protein n=1 Tax=Dipteronia sinensis TaxID=43782 RepID=A0AAE0E854_9ROSI|nr:hypothetical protein Dsin_012663 [Dipteronia sinensis]
MEIRVPLFSVVLGIRLFVYLVRIIEIYSLFSEEVTSSTLSKLAAAPIIKIGFNLLLFLYGGHLFGGLWYLFAVWKKIECWKKACSNHGGCQYANNLFNVSSGDKIFLDNICFAKTEDTKPYELGIFKDAFESHIVETTTELWKKFLYCFRWGLQNISGFGQNLEVSTYAWENIFVILIAIFGVGTFTYFVGNMQVERFRRWNDASLLHLCNCIKPKVYDERTHIVLEGDPIDEMLFVLHSKLWNFSSAASSTNNVPPRDRRKEFLKDGDVWGEELVSWGQDESSSSNKLISHTAIQALTKVEAFVLRIDDLKKLFNEKAKILQLWFRKRKKQDLWMELLTAIKSNREQTTPGDQLTGPEIVV